MQFLENSEKILDIRKKPQGVGFFLLLGSLKIGGKKPHPLGFFPRDPCMSWFFHKLHEYIHSFYDRDSWYKPIILLNITFRWYFMGEEPLLYRGSEVCRDIWIMPGNHNSWIENSNPPFDCKCIHIFQGRQFTLNLKKNVNKHRKT